jgi:hypothetical protein
MIKSGASGTFVIAVGILALSKGASSQVSSAASPFCSETPLQNTSGHQA